MGDVYAGFPFAGFTIFHASSDALDVGGQWENSRSKENQREPRKRSTRSTLTCACSVRENPRVTK